MKGFKLRIPSIAVIVFLPISTSYAAAYQIFPPLAYENPASLNEIKKAQLLIGATYLQPRLTFTGSDGPFVGEATSSTSDILPYGRVALRLSPNIVFGVDVSRPIYTDIRYPEDSIVRFSSTQTILLDVDYSPKICVKFNDQLAAGIGVNLNNLYDAQLNFVALPFGNVVNQGSDWEYGWNTGISYVFSKATTFNLSYFSEINHDKLTGNSHWGPFTTKDQFNVVIPATLTANVVQSLTKAWVMSATARYIDFSKEKNINLRNSALGGGTDVFVPLDYHDSWVGQLATRYQFNSQLTGKLAVEYDSNPQPLRTRPIGLPAYEVWVIGGGVDIAITKQLTAQFTYAHAFSNPGINSLGPVGPSIGKVDIDVNIVDVSLVFNL